ncbi:hypothetical protein YC2023_070928 [Brassica napus]|uniref:(rape) hypothetical protein n=1 Tax=Brassica napus TaxID=3708 RepID=A0A816S8E7_BRANA|nr:unnamed protein product [Brassica napus]
MVSWSPYILKSVALSESNAVLKSFSVLRCKGIPQNQSPTNAAITTVLLIEAHAAFGVDGCKDIALCVLPDAAKQLVVDNVMDYGYLLPPPPRARLPLPPDTDDLPPPPHPTKIDILQ